VKASKSSKFETAPEGWDTAFYKHKLGAKVKDQVTGLEGTVTCRMEWLYGCRRYLVQPPGNNQGIYEITLSMMFLTFSWQPTN